jgi:hypothetical protein
MQHVTSSVKSLLQHPVYKDSLHELNDAFSKMWQCWCSVHLYRTTRCHTPEDHNLYGWIQLSLLAKLFTFVNDECVTAPQDDVQTGTNTPKVTCRRLYKEVVGKYTHSVRKRITATLVPSVYPSLPLGMNCVRAIACNFCSQIFFCPAWNINRHWQKQTWLFTWSVKTLFEFNQNGGGIAQSVRLSKPRAGRYRNRGSTLSRRKQFFLFSKASKRAVGQTGLFPRE